jgi:hypothetical protein
VADKELLKLLEMGKDEWNRHRPRWKPVYKFEGPAAAQELGRKILEDFEKFRIQVDLSCADLGGRNLTHFDLQVVNLTQANLESAVLTGANLHKALLARANLRRTNLDGTNLWDANLSDADLTGAALLGTNFNGTILRGADLSNATLTETTLADLDLTSVIGLETCQHMGPSSIDHQTLMNSYPLPLRFLRGVGLPDNLIDYLPSLLNQPIQYFSCFISYSSKNDDFAKRIHADLQNKGVRCWFAPHDLPIGGKVLDEIDAAIRLRDKLVLVLSKDSIQSGWVEDEVTTAYEEERRRGRTVLFPIRLDEAIMDTKAAWASKLRMNRNIGDFRRWKDHDHYQEGLERVLRDLTAGPKNPGDGQR